MLTEKQINEIREHLENAKNPLFYYDNDADGLCSYILLRKFIDRGKGVSVRSFPDLNGSYARKAQELNADCAFVLDKPVLSKEFAEEIDKLGLPLIWIDHHDVKREEYEKDMKNLFIYNPARNKGKDKSGPENRKFSGHETSKKQEEVSCEPVTYLSYKIANRKEDIWLAVVGCIFDHYLPDFIDEFKERYPEFWTKKKVNDPFIAYYETEIGKIAMALNFGLKDSTTNIVKLQNFLLQAKEPSEIFSETGANHAFRKRFEFIKKKYDYLIDKAKENVQDNFIFFEYGGELSMSSDIANGLFYRFPGRYVAVAYRKDAMSNLSLRGKNVKKILEEILKEINGSGGGHEDAVGARIKTEDLGRFKDLFIKSLSHSTLEKLKI
ncbi:hypothetical protein J4462_02905 [Candidatus Pacearchaeota archaeon]|nr:hypothetical protein [Candidatus Pacearchaeota archaeon]